MACAYQTTGLYEHGPLKRPRKSRFLSSNLFRPVPSAKSLSLGSITTPLTIQPKLKVGSPNDKYEREADRVADQVIRMPEPGNVQTQASPPQIQRLCPECEEELQRQPEEEEEEELLQTKPIAGQQPTLSNGAVAAIQSLKGGGHPLPVSEEHFFGAGFNKNFSQVRIHADQRASVAAQLINARAFTHGHDIVFGQNQFNPRTTQGRRLLAHELTHVVQQSKGTTGMIQREEHVPTTGDIPEERFTLTSTFGRPPVRQYTFGNSTTYVLSGFATNSSELLEDHIDILQRIAAEINAGALVMGGFVTISGHADRRGTEEHNRTLGQQRADAVGARLLPMIPDTDLHREIRAYGVGEPEEGREGDIPEYRKVVISITRRSFNYRLLPEGEGELQYPTPTPDIEIPPPYEYRPPPETEEERDRRRSGEIFREIPSYERPRQSLNDYIDRGVNQILRGTPQWVRDLAAAGVRKGVDALVEQAVDAAGLQGEARQATITALEALRQQPF